MNQALLTRLFKSIEGERDTPLIKVAYSIIEEEKRKGHSKLAEKLDAILKIRLVRKIINLLSKLQRKRIIVFLLIEGTDFL